MKKLTIAGMLIASLTALVACGGASVEAAQEERMTCVVYFAYDDYRAGGVCVMVDANGKPLAMGEDE